MTFENHAAYFLSMPADVRERLVRIQAEVERQVPGALRCMGYNMPAFRQRLRFFYFAAFKQHIGIYPPLTDDLALVNETAPFRGPKGNLAFAHQQELPVGLIGRVAAALARQYAKP